jgi:ADP-ribose pyrophosphatase
MAEQSAVREIKEETGFDLKVYKGGNEAFRRPFYMGPGFTDESNGTVFGTIHVEEVEQQLESAERIQVMLADKEQVKRILKEERVTLRGAYLMMMFLNSGDGLDFLEV